MSKISSKRKYRVYDSLRMALKRAKVANPGKVATLLLETFLENNGFLKADMAIEAELCEKGKFGIWRDELQKKKFILFQYNGPGTPHRPGSKLNDYLNKEKLASCEIVIKSDLNQFPTKSEVDEKFATKQELEDLRKALEKMIEEFDPPYTEEKLEARLSVVKSTAKSVH